MVTFFYSYKFQTYRVKGYGDGILETEFIDENLITTIRNKAYLEIKNKYGLHQGRIEVVILFFKELNQPMPLLLPHGEINTIDLNKERSPITYSGEL